VTMLELLTLLKKLPLFLLRSSLGNCLSLLKKLPLFLLRSSLGNCLSLLVKLPVVPLRFSPAYCFSLFLLADCQADWAKVKLVVHNQRCFLHLHMFAQRKTFLNIKTKQGQAVLSMQGQRGAVCESSDINIPE